MKIKTNKHILSKVIKYWIDNYKLEDGESIYSHEFYVDTSKDIVIIELCIDKSLSSKEEI